MRMATRGVCSSLLMIVVLVYIFSIIIYMFIKEEALESFASLYDCMWVLMVNGTLLDGVGETMYELKDEQLYHLVIIFTLFILLSALTVMNMLIGVLCEVVTAVGENEKEQAAVDLMKHSVLLLLKRLDKDGSGEISQDEFNQVLADPEALQVLEELEVDVHYFIELMDMFFESHQG